MIILSTQLVRSLKKMEDLKWLLEQLFSVKNLEFLLITLGVKNIFDQEFH